MKWVKILASTFFVVLALLVVLAIALPSIMNVNDYRQDIINVVEDKTKRELQLNGNLSFSVFPWLGINAESVSFSQPNAIKGEMLSAKAVQLRIKLLPLMQKKIQIDTVVLESPSIRYITLADGTDSLHGLVDEMSQSEVEPSQDVEVDGNSDFQFLVEAVHIKNANIDYQDDSTQKKYQLKDVNVSMGNIFAPSSAEIKISGEMIDASDAKNPLSIFLEMNALASMDLAQEKIKLDDVLIRTELDALKLTTKVGNLRMDLAQEHLLIEDFHNTVSGSYEGTPVSADASLAQANIRVKEEQITLNKWRVTGEYDTIPWQLTIPKVDANIAKNTLVAKQNIQFVSDELVVNLSELALQKRNSEPALMAKLQIPALNLQQWLVKHKVDYQTENPKVLQKVGINAQLSFQEDRLKISALEYQMDETIVRGSAAISLQTPMKAAFDIELNAINADDYLPKAEEEIQRSAEQDEGAETADLEIPFDVFDQVIANGSLRAKQVIVGGLSVRDINVKVHSKDGATQIIPQAKLYDGTLQGAVNYTQKNGVKTLRIKQNIDLVDLNKMLTDADITDKLSGKGGVNIDVLFEEKSGTQSNKGSIELSAKDGEIQGVDVQKIIEEGYAKWKTFKGKSTKSTQEKGEMASEGSTKFAQMLAQFSLQDWVLHTKKMQATSPILVINGEGDIDLAKQTLDYLVNVTVSNQANPESSTLTKLQGVTIPIKFTGSLSEPKYAFDIKTLAAALLKKEFQNKKQEYLSKKLGIKNTENLSTDQAVKALLFKKLTKKPEKNRVKKEAKLSEEAQKKQEKDDAKNEVRKQLLNNIFGK